MMLVFALRVLRLHDIAKFRLKLLELAAVSQAIPDLNAIY